jgi:uncharacterized protein with HEPN domain
MRAHDEIVLGKIQKHAKSCSQFVGAMNFAEFSRDEKTVSACVFGLSQIGELVGKLSAEFVKANTEIPWQKIRGLRNRIVHDYDGVQLNIIWDVIKDFLPNLIKFTVNK